MMSNKEKILLALKQYKSIVEYNGDLAMALVEGDFDSVAELILAALPLKDDPQPQLQQADVMQPLRADIEHTVEYYSIKMTEQGAVGDYSTALVYQSKICALEEVLIKMNQSNVA